LAEVVERAIDGQRRRKRHVRRIGCHVETHVARRGHHRRRERELDAGHLPEDDRRRQLAHAEQGAAAEDADAEHEIAGDAAREADAQIERCRRGRARAAIERVHHAARARLDVDARDAADRRRRGQVDVDQAVLARAAGGHERQRHHELESAH
jgi:hypothetical protein